MEELYTTRRLCRSVRRPKERQPLLSPASRRSTWLVPVNTDGVLCGWILGAVTSFSKATVHLARSPRCRLPRQSPSVLDERPGCRGDEVGLIASCGEDSGTGWTARGSPLGAASAGGVRGGWRTRSPTRVTRWRSPRAFRIQQYGGRFTRKVVVPAANAFRRIGCAVLVSTFVRARG